MLLFKVRGWLIAAISEPNTPDLERTMLRMGSVAFIAGIVITIVSTMFHASSEDLTNHPIVFAVYAESDQWITAHIGQFAGVMLVFAGGFVSSSFGYL